MRSRAPSLHNATATRLPAACSADVSAHRLEHIGGLRALGGKIAAGARADIDHVARTPERQKA